MNLEKDTGRRTSSPETIYPRCSARNSCRGTVALRGQNIWKQTEIYIKPFFLLVDIQHNPVSALIHPREIPGTSSAVTKIRHRQLYTLYQVDTSINSTMSCHKIHTPAGPRYSLYTTTMFQNIKNVCTLILNTNPHYIYGHMVLKGFSPTSSRPYIFHRFHRALALFRLSPNPEIKSMTNQPYPTQPNHISVFHL